MFEIQPKFQTCEKQKNREKKTPKEKQSHAQDSIYVVRQFAYIHRVARTSLLLGKNYKLQIQSFSFFFFSLSFKHGNNTTLKKT